MRRGGGNNHRLCTFDPLVRGCLLLLWETCSQKGIDRVSSWLNASAAVRSGVVGRSLPAPLEDAPTSHNPKSTDESTHISTQGPGFLENERFAGWNGKKWVWISVISDFRVRP